METFDFKTTFNNGLLLDYRSARTQLPACQWHDDPFYVIKDGFLYRAVNAKSKLTPVRRLEPGTVVRLWDEEAENPILGTI
jgi:hypothetical protein